MSNLKTHEFEFMGSWLTFNDLANGEELATHWEGAEYRRAVRVEVAEGTLTFIHIDTRDVDHRLVGDTIDVFYLMDLDYQWNEYLTTLDSALSPTFLKLPSIVFNASGTIFVKDRDGMREWTVED